MIMGRKSFIAMIWLCYSLGCDGQKDRAYTDDMRVFIYRENIFASNIFCHKQV
jgi:hypothetical protein